LDLAACVHRCVHRHPNSAYLQSASIPAGGIVDPHERIAPHDPLPERDRRVPPGAGRAARVRDRAPSPCRGGRRAASGPAPRRRGSRNVRLLSSANTTYNRDYFAEEPDGRQNPLATVFVRRGGKIHHHWSSELYFAPTDPGQHPRHVDFIWPLWAVFDRTPEG